MSQTLSIEDALRKIAADNDLTGLTIGVTLKFTPGPYGFNAVSHYDGFARSGIACSRGTGATVEEALQDILAVTRDNRTPDTVELPTLAMEGLAA